MRLATRADNDALCSLARSIPLGGLPEVVQERGEDFFLLPSLHGGASDTYLVEDAEGRAVGCATHIVRDGWVGGRRQRVGQVGDIRLAPGFRGGRVFAPLARLGLERSRRVHGVALSSTSIAWSNRRARRAGASNGFASEPLARALMVSVPWRPARMPAGVAPARDGDLDELAAFLEQGQRSRLLGWALDCAELERRLATWPGLRLEDFLLVRRGGAIVGCAAPWDPSPARQTRIVRWGASLAAYCGAQALLARPLGRTPLPGPGGLLRTLFLTHLEAPDDDPSVLRGLVVGALARAGPGTHSVAAAVAHGSPLQRAFRGLGAHRLPLQLLAVGPAPLPSLPAEDDRRRLGFELALA